ncbi:flagellar export chaperone FliS [Fulvimonas sp. R45]|uniref:flagellar export chaperone FliS n=1 Tax=Fulvimonas sp. R45 TaxID=3045937 RepID=UPI00265D8558|nr:flagellar export chaperone FliS [Fulvimonas sp. R45]MDO1528348.1 flagellar export chaperone FliS [Fulvimonas sp. R45]
MNQAYARQATAMYRQNGARSEVEGADAHQLTAMLFDGALDRMAQACAHIRHGDVAGKGQCVSRAVAIVGELRAALDHAAGGQLSQRLDALYGYVTQRLLHAQLHDEIPALEECMRLLAQVRDGWRGIRGDYLAAQAAP